MFKNPTKTLMVALCTHRKRLWECCGELRGFGVFRATEDQHFTRLHIGLRGQLTTTAQDRQSTEAVLGQMLDISGCV